MEKYTNHLLRQVSKEIQQIFSEGNEVCTQTSKAIFALEDIFAKLKLYISTYTFNDESEEIYFFKNVKPQFSSKLIYYRKIYNIEILKPNGSMDVQYQYFKDELDRLKHFFDKNVDIYKYFRAGCNYLDKTYFLRSSHNIHLNSDLFYFEKDLTFSTNQDFKIAKILANEMLAIYLNSQLARLEKTLSVDNGVLVPPTKLKWTGKKVDLIEQIYAWESIGCFNNGNITIKELADYIEFVFDINLGDYYHTFMEMKNRKGARAAFLNRLIKHLDDRMLESDNK